ncbi:MAG TPA: GGDEF domain-containing protein [Methylomusa anaerophila]|uniref:Response regulator PleD n=1 Tax=Methylomusa anaerophila TaxID=1930071 RepID=A0A348AMC3_9FIRM|nr:GGDEF domain-containing protein [Methylomusa anaerophila]BBB92221.1 response regulator PleD [Methylomusa anaerophila]HML87765.1 GGDEF domain-containing protein [Methylomusa anaerophila]
MFYNHARFILTMLGIVTGMAGYYLEISCQVDYGRILWLGSTLTFAIGGFIIGGVIEHLSIRSHTDYLTGLWNRSYFYLKLREQVVRMAKGKGQMCVAMIDVDGFKKVNDLYGHAIGDVLLSGIAAILKQDTRNKDIVIRWGGDEFAVIFAETSLKNAFEIMERIRHKVEGTFSSYHLTISTGIISFEQDKDLKDLLIKADQTLYKAKELKNSVIASN